MSQEEVEIGEATGYAKCPVCGETVKSKGKYGHFSRSHQELNYQDYKGKFVPVQPPEKEGEKPSAPLYKGEPDVNSILREILRTHPDVPKRVVDEIISWAHMSPGGLHPTQVAYLLSSMKGVSSQTANIVAQKYSLALAKAQQEGKIQQVPMIPGLPPTSSQMMFPAIPGLSQQPSPTPSFMQYPTMGPTVQTGQGFPLFPPQATASPSTAPYLTREEFLRLREEEREKSKMDRLEERMDTMDKGFNEALLKFKSDLLDSIQKQREPEGMRYEEIREPIDKRGNVCPPEEAVSVRIRRVPIASVPSGNYLTREEFLKMREEEREKSKMDRLEERMNAIDKSFANALSSFKDEVFKRIEDYRGPDLQYVVEEVPVDSEGKPCPPEMAVSVKRIRRPPTVEREDFLDKFIKLKQAGILGKEKEIDESTIRRIMREEAERKTGESEEVRALRDQLNDSRKAIEDLKGAIEAKDRQLLVDKISGLESRLSAIATTGGEWRSDEMKVLASSIHELGEVIKGKRPMEAAREILVPLTPPPPASQMAGEVERGGVIEGLRPYGLVRSALNRSRVSG